VQTIRLKIETSKGQGAELMHAASYKKQHSNAVIGSQQQQ
jgi:hypothetical protein